MKGNSELDMLKRLNKLVKELGVKRRGRKLAHAR